MTEPWEVALLAAAALHAGFQLTVTVLVYPVLASAPASDWAAVHRRHSRRITPLVGLVYLAVLGSAVGALLAAPGPAVGIAVAATAAALGLTAGVAAPLHARLGAGRDAVLLRRLLRADRWRSTAAVLALAGPLSPPPAERPSSAARPGRCPGRSGRASGRVPRAV